MDPVVIAMLAIAAAFMFWVWYSTRQTRRLAAGMRRRLASYDIGAAGSDSGSGDVSATHHSGGWGDGGGHGSCGAGTASGHSGSGDAGSCDGGGGGHG